MGVTYSIFSVLLYPTIAYFVDENMMGKAYGLCTIFTNMNRVLVLPLIGKVQQNTTEKHGYFWQEVCFMGFALTALVLNVYIWIAAKKRKGN